MTLTAAPTASPGKHEQQADNRGKEESQNGTMTFEQLGVLGIDGTKTVAVRENTRNMNQATRSFEQPTEAFVRKTGMRDKGPPGYEYNNTEHLSVSATAKPGSPGSAVFLAARDGRFAGLPGVHVRSYPTSPTRDDRLEGAQEAAQTRADEAQRLADKLRRDRKKPLANSTRCILGHPEKQSVDSPWKEPLGVAPLAIRPLRSGALEEQDRREALDAKARAIAPSPRAGKPDLGACRKPGDGNGRKLRTGPGREKNGMYHGVKIPLQAFETPFAGGSQLDALPGRLESLIFPQRYLDWPKEDAPLPTLALDVKSSPIRHAVAFNSKQPRIVCYDPQRETRGWDGPGAYEWDDRSDDVVNTTITRKNNRSNNDGPIVADTAAAGADAPTGESFDTTGVGGIDESPTRHGVSVGDPSRVSRAGHCPRRGRPRGLSVRDPERPSPAFREGSSGFVPPMQTNVRGFPVAPSTASAVFGERLGPPVAADAVGMAGDNGGNGARGSWGIRGNGGAVEEVTNKNQGNHEKKPRAHWMFLSPMKEGLPALTTEGWGGPGAYSIEQQNMGVKVKEPERKSPVFVESSGGKRGRGTAQHEREMWNSNSPERSSGRNPDGLPGTPTEGGRRSPCTPDILANWSSPHLDYVPPEPKTVAHGVRRQSPNRFGFCFLSVTDRFYPDGIPRGFYRTTTPAGLGPGAGEMTNGGDIAGPVERYDLITSRQQPPASNTWLGTSIRPGLPYNPSLGKEIAATSTTTSRSTANHHHRPHRSSEPFSPPLDQLVRETATTGDASETPVCGVGLGSNNSSAGGSSKGTDVAPLSLAAVGKRVEAMKNLTSHNAVPAAEAIALAAAATAAAGLAQGWAGRGMEERSGVNGVGDLTDGVDRDERGGGRNSYKDGGVGGGGGGGGGGARGAIPSRKIGPKAVSTDSKFILDSDLGQHTMLSIATTGGGEYAMPSPRDSPHTIPNVTESRRITAAVSWNDNINDNRPWRHHKRWKRSKKRLTASSGFIANGLLTMGTGCVNTRKSSFGSCSAPPAAVVGTITEEGLAAAEKSLAAAAAASAAERDGDLIRTVGRAKRGPCMWTLSGSREVNEEACIENEARLAGRSHRSKHSERLPLWEAEVAGGLLGPGETRVLVC